MSCILIVDDDVAMRRMLRANLEAAGHEVIEAANGRKAERELAQRTPDLLITDIIMPDKEGIELITSLRKARTFKILAISGGSQTMKVDFLEVAKRLGADATMAKPFRREELLVVVRQLLGST